MPNQRIMGLRWGLALVAALAVVAACCPAAQAIVGGVPVPKASDVPYQGALHLHGQTARTSQFCGAVIRDTTHVLTAAHCVFDNEHTAPGQPVVPGDLEVLVGTTTLLSGGQHVQVAAVSIDPNYDPSSFAQDIAVLTLAQPLTTGNPITPIDEGAWSNVDVGTPLTVSGWGDTANNPQTKNTELRWVTVPLRDPAFCQAGYLGYDPAVTICAGEGDGDACFGDSGGPLVYQPANVDRLVGIVSFGGPTCNDAMHPGGYTKLAAPAVRAYATQPQPADAPRNLAPPTVVGTAQAGSTVTCDPGSWAGSPSLAYQFLRPTATGDIALTSLGGEASYTLRDGDAGQSVRCTVKGTNAGGLAIAASAAVGVAPRDNPQPLPPQPQPEPEPTPQPVPQQDVSSPVARVTSSRCTTTRCTLNVTVTDAGFSAGIKTVTASVRSTYSTTCKRKGKRVECVKRRTKRATVTRRSANRFRVVASKLPVGLQLFTLVAVDKAGHRQPLPTRKTLRTRAKRKTARR
jgi:secreted trypsin-like serine protease